MKWPFDRFLRLDPKPCLCLVYTRSYVLPKSHQTGHALPNHFGWCDFSLVDTRSYKWMWGYKSMLEKSDAINFDGWTPVCKTGLRCVLSVSTVWSGIYMVGIQFIGNSSTCFPYFILNRLWSKISNRWQSFDKRDIDDWDNWMFVAAPSMIEAVGLVRDLSMSSMVSGGRWRNSVTSGWIDCWWWECSARGSC